MFIEFVDGPLDGEIRQLPAETHSFHLPVIPRIRFYDSAAPEEALVLRELVYRRTGRKKLLGTTLIHEFSCTKRREP